MGSLRRLIIAIVVSRRFPEPERAKMSAPTITEVFPLTDEADAGAIIGILNEVWAELAPHRAPVSIVDHRASYTTARMKVRHFLAVGQDGDRLGLLITLEFLDGSNDHLVFVEIDVLRRARRRGIGTALLAKALEVATEGGRTTMGFDTYDTVPAGAQWCESFGATVAMREHLNAVEVVDLDIEMLERWRREGPSRAPGYDMLIWTDGYPTEYLEQVAGLWFMGEEDMPLEDMTFNPPSVSASFVAERLEQSAGVLERLTAIPRHIESDTLVGFSELLYRRSDPNNIQTTLTMVHRDHRGHALGKWVKAAVILEGLMRWPNGRRILTENAKSNDAMLGINDAIGFKPLGTLLLYEAETTKVDKYLARNT